MKRKKGLQRGAKSRSDAAASLPPPTFHSPFRDLAAVLKGRRAAPSPPAAPEVAARPSGPSSKNPPVGEGTGRLAREAGSLSEEEALAVALQGVERLSPASSRVRLRRRAKLSDVDARIEASRREELDALGRGDGFDVTFEDRYVRARAAGVSRETLSRLEKGGYAICAHLDLHGLPLDDARRSVDVFLAAQQKRGHHCVLLVTGKGKNSIGGRGVLREQVPQWLARGPSARRVLAFASARPCDGGLGALVVLMRAGSSSKNQIDVEHGGVGPVGT